MRRVFQLGLLSAGLFVINVSAVAQVTVTPAGKKVTIRIDGQPEMAFFYGPEVTKPYLYPLRAPSGSVMTRQWPMDPQPGERHDHIHHRGVWFAHSNVNGIDFWNSDPSYHNPQMGHIVVTKIGKTVSGQKAGAMAAALEWQDPANNVLLTENRTMTFYSGSPREIDFDILLTARRTVRFGDDKDGVFGIRLAPELEEAAQAPSDDNAFALPTRSGQITSSNGCHQEAECWGKRADWIDVSGTVRGAPQGTLQGIAILDHPKNPRHPTYWHVRGYGLLAANVFGVKAFTKNPAADGSLTLQAGEQLRFRYRVVIHAGDAQAAGIAGLYRSYARGGSMHSLR